MGKVLEDIADDTTSLAQWVFRKLRNHDPMSVRDAPKRRKGVREEVRVNRLAETGNTVRYAMNDGRVFEISVKQVQTAVPELIEA